MRTDQGRNGASPAAIFTRMWETEDGKLPRTLARLVLKAGFPERDRARMHELAVKNQEGTISNAELSELDNYVSACDLMALLQSQARRALQTKKSA